MDHTVIKVIGLLFAGGTFLLLLLQFIRQLINDLTNKK